ncbi:hypothetical protein QAO71_17375 (plasmid) [Halopseudomonas sp. SMJS2]|uniref:hypothetical protein n=1 Tax=Halopseudomonas sp. SMJS2 TaxID=3041098 RepID=UPI002452A6F1|nr:hypothetical protein [Halopseudomonas sp. SMJS2]WGK63540.1 hypothetical protein QAO71_17375 [Halopseudomonas sp. SMJS2]
MRKKNKGFAALKAKAASNGISDQGRSAWFRFSGLQFYRLNGGEWAVSVLLALMVAGLIAYVAGPTASALVITSADFLMIFGFAAMSYSITRSSDYEKSAKRFKTIAILVLIIVHFVIQIASWPA